MKDYYAILNIPRTATAKEIKQAYRSLAMQWHPDRNKDPSAHNRFVEIQEAYSILRDATQRLEYDRLLNESETERSEPATSKTQYDEWVRQAKDTAEKYANKEYEDFLKTVINEVKLNASYLPNIVAMAITACMACVFLFIGLFQSTYMASEPFSLGILIFLSLVGGGFAFITLKLYRVMAADYRIDRNKYKKRNN